MKSSTLPSFEFVRQQFPALERMHGDRPAVFFDGPAGTQVPRSVIDAIGGYLVESNANHGGLFATSRENDARLHEAQRAFADLLGASDPDEIVFGPNMTTLAFSLAQAVAETWNRGDEIVVTRLDHDANIRPWVRAAQARGVVVRWIDVCPSDGRLRMDQMHDSIGPRTRWVAVGCASNATGGINPVRQIADWAHQQGALVFLDAVHFGPHDRIDVSRWDCDFLACSAYKFFGPHLGILWGRRALLESLPATKVRPSANRIPDRWMTGTPAYELIQGGRACVDYLADLGRQRQGDSGLARPAALDVAFGAIREYERERSRQMLVGLRSLPGIRIHGIGDPERVTERFPTFAITHESIGTTELAERLGDAGIFVWQGNYYAIELTERLGVEPEGMVRIGLVHYNTAAEVDRFLETLRDLLPEGMDSC